MRLRALALALLVGTALSAPAQAALTATTKGNGQNTSNHSLTVSSVTVPSGDLVVVLGFIRKAATGDAIVVTNSTGDTFSTPQECFQTAGSTNSSFISWAVSSGMSGGTVTVADDAAATATGITFAVYGLSGVPGSTPEDTASRACAALNTTTTAPTVTSAAPTQSGNIFFSVYGNAGNAGTLSFTEDATWTGGYGTGNSSVGALAGYKVNAGASAVTRSPTTASRTYAMPITSFKDGAAATSSYGGGTTIGVGH